MKLNDFVVFVWFFNCICYICLIECKDGYYNSVCLGMCGYCLNRMVCNKNIGYCFIGCMDYFKYFLC